MVNYLCCLIISLLTLTGCNTTASIEQSCKYNAAAHANIKLGLAFLEQGCRKEAKQKLLLAQKLDRGDPAVWCAMGYFKEIMGEIAQANKDYKHAVKLAPRNGATHTNYGEFLFRTAQYGLAIKQFLFAVNDPEYLDTATAYENAGLCALKIHDAKSAQYYFQKALHHEPSLKIAKSYLSLLAIGKKTTMLSNCQPSALKRLRVP